jgi:hypothetical protein
MSAVILGLVGVCGLVAFAAHADTDKWLYVLITSTAPLLPAVLYLLTLRSYVRSEPQVHHSPGTAGANPPGAFKVVLSVALYLPCVILMARDASGWKQILELVPLFLVLWMFCACANQWLRGVGSVSPAENGRLPRVLHRGLEMTSGFFRPRVLLHFGAILLACSLWTENVAFRLLKGQEMWITAEYGLGYQIPAARLYLNYFGRFVYGGSLLLGGCTVVMLLTCKLSSGWILATRAAPFLGLAVGFLAICSITDFYFSWQSLLLGEHLPAVSWILFLLLFLHWLVPVFLAISILRARREGKGSARLELRTVVVFYVPLLLFDLAMAPFFLSLGGWNDTLFPPFILVTFVGLQFLAWGYLQLAALP